MPGVSPGILPGCISYGCMCLALLKNDSLRENLSLQASGSSVVLGRIRNLILTPNLVCFLQGFKGDIAKWVGNSFWLKFSSLEGKTVWRDQSGWSMAVGFRIQGRHTPWREAGGWSWHTVKGGFVFSFPFCAEAAAPGIPLENQPHQRVKGRVFTCWVKSSRVDIPGAMGFFFLQPVWHLHWKTFFMWAAEYGSCGCWKPRISAEGGKIHGGEGAHRELLLQCLFQWVAWPVAWRWGIAA